MNTKAKPGSVLKSLRLANGWTLSEVSRRTGLPVSTLSKVENDKMSLSYDKLARISRGLEIDIGLLFSSEATPPISLATGRRSISRAGEGRIIETDTYVTTYCATDLLNKRFVPLIAEIHARTKSDFSEMIRHPGEEYAFVLEGTAELHTDLYAPVTLETGDSIYFDSGMGHIYLNVGEGRCRVLSICSGDESQLIAASGGQEAAPANDPPLKAVKSVKATKTLRPADRRRAGRS
ncbi:XRE family transcriptional regulator [Phenylobacterium sp.]|uniref:helix-turn-helix domain-containing protein n=1 Tax=Phenylobacterium sp. TaxID=1871053 RepID=UPI0012041C7A|nr:XRE family transcriptional regulator [Phenylobacterium sp.]THD71699.1 MAG: XRE family transcriptional regulator [Phenylobacterium sp.]